MHVTEEQQMIVDMSLRAVAQLFPAMGLTQLRANSQQRWSRN
jgi:hypothetical protein